VLLQVARLFSEGAEKVRWRAMGEERVRDDSDDDASEIEERAGEGGAYISDN
jgi:hypothetical protein